MQTLIALSSDNSRILLLDEPFIGLDSRQKSELVKAIWWFKKDRYIVMHCADIDMVNIMADQVALVQPDGIEMLQTQEMSDSIGSYRLIVQVEGGKPSENLVRYL